MLFYAFSHIVLKMNKIRKKELWTAYMTVHSSFSISFSCCLFVQISPFFIPNMALSIHPIGPGIFNTTTFTLHLPFLKILLEKNASHDNQNAQFCKSDTPKRQKKRRGYNACQVTNEKPGQFCGYNIHASSLMSSRCGKTLIAPLYAALINVWKIWKTVFFLGIWLIYSHF